MPKMTHWNSPEPVDVAPEKVAVYAGQGWVPADSPRTSAKVAAMTTDAAEAPKPVAKAPAKKATKKPAKRASKKP